jgi:hypothetical protein
MSKEIPDELAGWRRLLREPDALPGQSLADKDAAWDKLFERLNAKPRRRLSGYRIVAACILVLLIPATRLLRDRPAPQKGMPVAERVRPVAPSRAPVVTPGVCRSGLVPVSRTSVAAEQTRKVSPVRDRVAALAEPAPPPARQPVTSDSVSQKAGPIESTPPVIRVESEAPARPSKAAPKKQWKVVDINELETGHDRPRSMVADRQIRPLRLGLGIGNAGAMENPPAARGDDSRLKINLTTQNH